MKKPAKTAGKESKDLYRGPAQWYRSPRGCTWGGIMSRVIWIETRECGLLGRFFKRLLVVFNFLMIVWLASRFLQVGGAVSGILSGVGSESIAIVSTISAGMLVGVWFVGNVVLGVFVLMTRGKKVMITDVLD